jgi:hypothetical protein
LALLNNNFGQILKALAKASAIVASPSPPAPLPRREKARVRADLAVHTRIQQRRKLRCTLIIQPIHCYCTSELHLAMRLTTIINANVIVGNKPLGTKATTIPIINSTLSFKFMPTQKFMHRNTKILIATAMITIRGLRKNKIPAMRYG